MNIYLLLFAIAAAMYSSFSLAGGIQSGLVKKVTYASKETPNTIYLEGSISGRPSCATQPYWRIESRGSEDGSQKMITILTALQMRHPILITGTGQCTQWTDVEDVETVTVLEAPKIAIEQNGKFTNITTEGNLASHHAVECIPLSKSKSIYTPADIYKAVGKCLAQEQYDLAVKLVMLADAYGFFDAARVTDTTAHQAILALKMNTYGGVAQEKKTKFSEVIKQFMSVPGNRGALCEEIHSLGMPNYYPSYMILHGVKAFNGNPHDGALAKDFDPSGTWKNISLKCRG